MTYREQAESNERVADELRRLSFGDWAITALFYAGLHYVNEMIPECQKFERHVDRDDFLKINRPSIWPKYKALLRKSYDVRYKPSEASKARRSTGVIYSEIKSVLDSLKENLGIR